MGKYMFRAKTQVNENPSFMTLRRKFTSKMLKVSETASYAFEYR